MAFLINVAGPRLTGNPGAGPARLPAVWDSRSRALGARSRMPGRRREAPDPLAQVGHILTEGSDQNHRDGWNRLAARDQGLPGAIGPDISPSRAGRSLV